MVGNILPDIEHVLDKKRKSKLPASGKGAAHRSSIVTDGKAYMGIVANSGDNATITVTTEVATSFTTNSTQQKNGHLFSRYRGAATLKSEKHFGARILANQCYEFKTTKRATRAERGRSKRSAATQHQTQHQAQHQTQHKIQRQNQTLKINLYRIVHHL